MLIIHKVEKGDTISSIAKQYQIPIKRLMEDNGLTYDSTLNTGEVIVIVYPKQTYMVKEGDVLADIAQENGVTIMDLLRNNPSLSNRKYLEVGEELVISYDKTDKTISVNGMTFSFISEQILRKTLPFLTYITIIGYEVDANATITNIEDENIIQMALNYGVIPLMLLGSLKESSQEMTEITHDLLNSQELQNNLIDNIIILLKSKGYFGVIFGFQYIKNNDLPKYTIFIKDATKRLHDEGFISGAVLIPETFEFSQERPFNEPSFSEIGQIVDGVILLSYQWATGYLPNSYQTSYFYLKDYLEAAVTLIPPEKIYIGVSRIAYDLAVPYKEKAIVSSLTIPGALELARLYGSEIYYDEESKIPYFRYNTGSSEHIVWLKDARYTNAILELVDTYGLGGISIWNIMYYFRIWLMINSQYNIVKLLPSEFL